MDKIRSQLAKETHETICDQAEPTKKQFPDIYNTPFHIPPESKGTGYLGVPLVHTASLNTRLNIVHLLLEFTNHGSIAEVLTDAEKVLDFVVKGKATGK